MVGRPIRIPKTVDKHLSEIMEEMNIKKGTRGAYTEALIRLDQWARVGKMKGRAKDDDFKLF